VSEESYVPESGEATPVTDSMTPVSSKKRKHREKGKESEVEGDGGKVPETGRKEKVPKKTKRQKTTITMGTMGAEPTDVQVAQVVEALGEHIDSPDVAMSDDVEIITEPVTEGGPGNPFVDDLDLPEVDEAMVQEFMYVERNRGDVEVALKSKEQSRARFAERIQGGPKLVFEGSQRVWGMWYKSLLRQKTNDEAKKEVMALICRRFGVLVTVSGESVGPKGIKIISKVVGSLLQSSAPSISPIPENNKWAMIECVNTNQYQTLLAAAIVYNAQEEVFVTFRKPQIAQNLYRALEIRGIGTEEHWEKVRARLTGEAKGKVTIMKTYPVAFTPGFQERTTWWIKFMDHNFAFPERLAIQEDSGSVKHISISDAVTCSVCAGYGHHYQLCEYNKLKKVNLRATFGKRKEQREEEPVAGPSGVARD
jgi:hypothetical protein